MAEEYKPRLPLRLMLIQHRDLQISPINVHLAIEIRHAGLEQSNARLPFSVFAGFDFTPEQR